MSSIQDGPVSPLFAPVELAGNVSIKRLPECGVSPAMIKALAHAPTGKCVCWGLPFRIRKRSLLWLRDEPVCVSLDPLKARWLVFLHTADLYTPTPNAHGFFSPMKGDGGLAEHVANYVMVYRDGSTATARIRRRHQVGSFRRLWGENCFQAVPHHKPVALPAQHEQPAARSSAAWGPSQTRVDPGDEGPWLNWLYAWENPHPDRALVGLRLEPVSGAVLLFALTAGQASATPLRWETRRKAVLTLPRGAAWDPKLDEHGQLAAIQLDMGTIVSARLRPVYPNRQWARSVAGLPPGRQARDVLLEYTAHPDARFHLADGSTVPVARLAAKRPARRLAAVAPAARRVRLRVIDKDSGRPVPVRLHVHGEAGEYLAPVDRHRIPNPSWFEDYSAELVGNRHHGSTYIDGETVLDLPLGRVYVEVLKGFEIAPVRQVFTVGARTDELVLTLEKVLPWRARGWVSADTHVHFLSPPTAGLEGAGEGVNVVNLLASQWGELMTNVGDFDGRTTFGARECGGDGEHLVRVGTENRQHVLGHISLLGYNGRIIAPMCSGGVSEAALGDPIDILLLEWARQCRQQGGLVVLPHFPEPRAENAAAIVNGLIDGIEMRVVGGLPNGFSGGLDPYSLSDWYRYLNCGYFVPAVGGTDKMSAARPVGASRTYARLADGADFTYEAWKTAVRSGQTFVTCGPLLEFAVEGKPAGARIQMNGTGGTVTVSWQAASLVMPLCRAELVVNGEIRASQPLEAAGGRGEWTVPIARSSWLALLLRGRRPDGQESIGAHSSPVVVEVEGSAFMAAADAVTILDQIEGAMAYLDTVGTRAQAQVYKRMRLELVAAHRALHNRLHKQGRYHQHAPHADHAAHHRHA